MNGPWFDNFHAKYPNIPIGCSEYGCEALNWFDIETPEGYFSLNDKLSDIMATESGKMLFAGLMAKMMSGMSDGGGVAGFDVTPDMMQMMGGFTVLRLTSLMGAANVNMTKEQLLDLNAKLNSIKKT